MIVKPTRGILLNKGHPLARGLVGYWLMNEGSGGIIQDLSGNINHGTNTGLVWQAGKFGQGLYSDGSSGNGINCGNKSILNFTSENFTLCFWCNLTYGSNDVIAARGAYQADGWYIQQFATNKIGFFTNQASARQDSYTGNNTYSDGVLFHLAIVRNGTSVKIYVDGVDVTSTSGSHTNPATSTRNLYIGRYDSTGLETIGLFETASTYNRALSDAEIAWFCREPFCVVERNPIELWSAACSGAPPVGAAGIMTTNTGYWGATY